MNLVTRKSFAGNQVSFSVDTLAGLRALAVGSPQLRILDGRLHPLVVAEVNPHALRTIPMGIVANPNCTTMRGWRIQEMS